MPRRCTAFVLFAAVGAAAGAAAPFDPLYDRIAGDLAANRPIVITVYVALCDNASQGIVPVKNRSICDGDAPSRNLYWATGGGLAGAMRSAGWKRVHAARPADGPILAVAAWRASLAKGGALATRGHRGRAPVYVVGLAYRGREIRAAMVDFFRAVHRDTPLAIATDDGATLAAGGASHVVGYIGHDYFYDTLDPDALLREARGDSASEKGAFALSCTGNVLIRPGLRRANVRILLLNRTLAFPGAWSVAGIARGLAQGRGGRGIRREAAAAFADGMGISVAAALGGFAGD
jgi:hypothetical protein